MIFHWHVALWRISSKSEVPLTTEKYRAVPYVFFFFPSSLPGGGGTQLRRYKPACPPKPSDLAQRFKVPGGRVSLSNLTPASSTSSISSITSLTSGSSSCSFRHPLQRRNPIIPDTVKLPPGINPQAETFCSTQSLLGKQALKAVRKREQPGRRKDSTQSLYIDSPECDLLLHFSSCPPSASSSSNSIAQTLASPQDQNHDRRPLLGQRRFSDPDIPYVDDDVWCGQRRQRWLSFCFFVFLVFFRGYIPWMTRRCSWWQWWTVSRKRICTQCWIRLMRIHSGSLFTVEEWWGPSSCHY